MLFQICPVCAASPGGDPNRVTDDLGGHLNMEHRNVIQSVGIFIMHCKKSRHIEKQTFHLAISTP